MAYLFNRRIKEHDFISNDYRFYYYLILPEESGTIFTARGPGSYLGRDPHGAILYILPPIDEFGEGLVFTFKPGPWTEYYLFTHTGMTRLQAGSYTCEETQYGYRTADYLASPESTGAWGTSSGQDTFANWHYAPSSNNYDGYTNATLQVQSVLRPSPQRGGIWLITQDESEVLMHPYHWTPKLSFDWYNIRQRFPAQASVVDTAVDPAITGASSNRHPTPATYFTMSDPTRTKITKTASYTLSISETGSVVTNTGATHDVTFTLPSAQRGLQFFFLVKTNDLNNIYLRIRAAEGDYIQAWVDGLNNESVKEIYSSIVNANIELCASDDTNWHFIHQVPEWDVCWPYFTEKYKTTVHVPGDIPSLTPAYNVASTQDGTFFTTSGNLSHCTFTLPAAQAGLEYLFAIGTSMSGTFGATVATSSSDVIFISGVLNGCSQLTSYSYWDTLKVKAVNSLGWWPITISGGWSAG